MTTRRNNTTPSLTNFVITVVHRSQDLRGVSWRADVLYEWVHLHNIKEGEAHVFINKKQNRSRWIVMWQETPFLIMAPADTRLTHATSMAIAATFAANRKIRDDLHAEITDLV